MQKYAVVVGGKPIDSADEPTINLLLSVICCRLFRTPHATPIPHNGGMEFAVSQQSAYGMPGVFRGQFMELSLKEVASIFDVGEREIIRWVHEEDLPAALVSDQYRFHRVDLLEWATLRQRPFHSSIYLKAGGDLTPSATNLADALERGGVLSDVNGDDLTAILHRALSGLPIPESLGLDNLIDLILQRDDFGCVAIGHGIAVPHPRRPVILDTPGPYVRLCYLRQPLEFTGPDGRAVDKLFMMFSPSMHEHLQLLACLGAVLQVEDVRQALEQQSDLEPLCKVMRDAGSHFYEPQTATADS